MARAMENIRAEVVEFEREGILRGSVSAADQGNHMCYTHLIQSLSLKDQHRSYSRRRIKTDEKVKVVACVGGGGGGRIYSVPCHASYFACDGL